MQEILTKHCPKCNLEKQITCFYRDSYKKSGYRVYCKSCTESIKKDYREKHSYKVLETQNKRRRERYKEDIQYKLRYSISNRIRKILKNNFKSKSTMLLLGCSVKELKQHLQKQFKEGMSWDNHGFGDNKWHIDHIKPCCSFDLNKPEEQSKCFHYTNLQPLWQSENLSKNGRQDWRL